MTSTIQNLANELFKALAKYEQTGNSRAACEDFVIAIDDALKAGIEPALPPLLPASLQEAHLATVRKFALAFKLTQNSARFRSTLRDAIIENVLKHLRGEVNRKFDEFVQEELAKTPIAPPTLDPTWGDRDYRAALALLQYAPNLAVRRLIHPRTPFKMLASKPLLERAARNRVSNLGTACQLLLRRSIEHRATVITAREIEDFCRKRLQGEGESMRSVATQTCTEAAAYGRGAQLMAHLARHLTEERKAVLESQRRARKRAWSRLGREVWLVPALPLIPELAAAQQKLEHLGVTLDLLNHRLGTSLTLDALLQTTISIKEIQNLLDEINKSHILDALAKLGIGNIDEACTSEAPAFVERFKTPVSLLVEVPTARMPGPIRGLEFGGDVSRMLSSEALLLTNADEQDDDLSYLFYAKVLERRLLSYQFDSRRMAETQVEQEQNVSRRTRGPLIIIGDESGSMYGVIRFAKALILGLAMIAHREKRECKLIFFSNQVDPRNMTLLFSDGGIKALHDFVVAGMSGGTDIVPPLKKALQMADGDFSVPPAVVIVTDGEFGPIDSELRQKVRAAQHRGVTFTAVHLPDDQNSFGSQTLDFCDKIHTLNGKIRFQA
jgi:hypothetical protein